MAEFVVSGEVLAFMREHIESYEQVEVLILLRAHREQSWTSSAVATHLRITTTMASEALRFLCRENILSVQVGPSELLFKYAPRPAELGELVNRFVQAYDAHRLEVMKLMTANALERLRTKALRKFSDSFLIARKKKEDG